jgi:hypothetical protein
MTISALPSFFINFERVYVHVDDKIVASIEWKMSVPMKSNHDEWEIKHFFVMVKDKCCLICKASISFPKMGNPECHYNALHNNKHDADFLPESEIRKRKLKELKSKSAPQQQLMAK